MLRSLQKMGIDRKIDELIADVGIILQNYTEYRKIVKSTVNRAFSDVPTFGWAGFG